MNNLSSYCGFVDAKIRASNKDLPVNDQPRVGTQFNSAVGWIFVTIILYVLCIKNAHMVLSGHLSNTSWYFCAPKKISVQICTSYKSQVKPNEDKSLNQFEKWSS